VEGGVPPGRLRIGPHRMAGEIAPGWGYSALAAETPLVEVAYHLGGLFQFILPESLATDRRVVRISESGYIHIGVVRDDRPSLVLGLTRLRGAAPPTAPLPGPDFRKGSPVCPPGHRPVARNMRVTLLGMPPLQVQTDETSGSSP